MNFTVVTKRKIVCCLSIILGFLLLVYSLSFSGAYAVFYGKATKKLPIYSVETSEKKIAISFDCAWGVDYTDSLLQTMSNHNVKCTFFMVEFWVDKHPDYVKKINDLGHEIGTHSATHPYMSKLSKTAMVKELQTSSKKISDITGKRVQVFRPPYGDYNDLLIETATELGLYVIQWDVDSLDWKDISKQKITERVLNRVKNGSIVLFHNQGLHTHEALEDVIVGLRSKGYSFVTIGDLIYKDNYYMQPDGRQVLNS